MPSPSPHQTSAPARVDSAISRTLNQSTGSYELVVGAVILGLIGYGIDRMVGTTPVFLLLFTILGFVGAAVSLYYRYQEQMRQVSDS